MNTSNRRVFIMQLAAGSSLLAAGAVQAQAKLEESDAQAVGLGYKHDTTKVDAKKYPKHDKAQKCTNCQLWQSKVTDAWGGCPLFAGKQVAGNGWCTAYVKKAG